MGQGKPLRQDIAGAATFRAGRTTLPEKLTESGCGTILYHGYFVNNVNRIDSQIRPLPARNRACSAISNPKLFIFFLPLTSRKVCIEFLRESSGLVTAAYFQSGAGDVKRPDFRGKQGENDDPGLLRCFVTAESWRFLHEESGIQFLN
jgi:hypothetical protein